MEKVDREYYRVNFARLRKLFKEVHDLDIQYRDIGRELEKVGKVAQALRSFLRHDLSTFFDSKLNEEFETLIDYERELIQDVQSQTQLEVFFDQSINTSEEKDDSDKFNKTQYFIKMMYQGDLLASPAELYSAIKSTIKKDLYDKTLIYSILRKLKSRGIVAKDGDRYFLTDDGLKFAKEIE